jgi:hypothetical protein
LLILSEIDPEQDSTPQYYSSAAYMKNKNSFLKENSAYPSCAIVGRNPIGLNFIFRLANYNWMILSKSIGAAWLVGLNSELPAINRLLQHIDTSYFIIFLDLACSLN